MKKKRIPKPISVPLWLALPGNGLDPAGNIRLSVELELLKLSKESNEREPMDSVGKFIAFGRALTLERDAQRVKDKTNNESVWALCVLAAEHWRAVEARWDQRQVASLTTGERQLFAQVVDVVCELLKSCTHATVARVWRILDNEAAVRAFLGCGSAGVDDTGKLDLFFAERAAA